MYVAIAKPAVAITFPAFPEHAQPAILRMWQEAHEKHQQYVENIAQSQYPSYERASIDSGSYFEIMLMLSCLDTKCQI